MDNFASLHTSITVALVATTRTTSQLASEDIPFHRSLDASFASSLDTQNARLLGLAERIIGAATANTETVRPPRLSDIDAVDADWRQVVDVVDSLLERADIALDEFTGAVKRLSPGVGGTEAANAATAKVAPRGSRIAAVLQSQNIEKPQLLFEHVPTNKESGFRPLLESKPHATVPLDLEAAAQHPYQKEIEQFIYPESIRTETEPTMYRPFETTTATFVNTEEAMHEMLEELKTVKEIAVDLEHHDQRSYIGIVSLMQISTRDKDWIVDTLKPWRRKLSCLNQVFADPSIIKVLHGAFMDIVWLQRDLGLYMVGLFDTHYAARALGYTSGSLAFLLDKFINVQAQKQYQTADWRVRPLPQELFDYARSDTHYLLYIFDCMKNELIQRSDFSVADHEKDKIWDVLQKSSETALQRYEHPQYDYKFGQGLGGWYKMFIRSSLSLTKDEFAVFRAVHRWRDETAREQDDSVHYVMPNHQIITLAKSIPDTRAALYTMINNPSQTIRLRADELVSVIVQAKESAKDGPEPMHVLSEIESKFPRRQYVHKPEKPAQHAVASYIQQIRKEKAKDEGPNFTPASTIPLRTSTSAFWGPNPQFQPKGTRRLSSVGNAITLTIPLPPLTAEIFADGPVGSEPESKASSPSPEPASAEPEDDTFILNDHSRKRKRADRAPPPAPLFEAEAGDENDALATQSDVVTLPGSETARLQAKAEKKAAKKAAKKNKIAVGEDEDGETKDEESVFDYESAPSMLNPPRESREEMKERRKREKNPWAKSMDAPKGLARGQKESAGRSRTFKD